MLLLITWYNGFIIGSEFKKTCKQFSQERKQRTEAKECSVIKHHITIYFQCRDECWKFPTEIPYKEAEMGMFYSQALDLDLHQFAPPDRRYRIIPFIILK